MVAHDSWAKVYDEVYERSFKGLYEPLTKETLKLLVEEATKGCKIIDFGAGTGRLSLPLSELGYEVTAVDPSLEMLKILQSKDLKKRIEVQNEFIQGFVSTEQYDFALCVFSVLVYLHDEDTLNKAIAVLKKCLKPNGLLLIDVPMLVAFQSPRPYEDSKLVRKIKIDKGVNDKYFYQEYIEIKEGDKSIPYTDNFNIKYWSPEIVLNKMKKRSFIIQKDLSKRFSGSGSLYYLLKLIEK